MFEFGSMEFLDRAHQTVTGVIDDYIDLTEPRDRCVRGALDRCSICYIHRDGENAIRRPQNLLSAACVTGRCDHRVALFKHRLCDRETQPARRASYEPYLRVHLLDAPYLFALSVLTL